MSPPLRASKLATLEEAAALVRDGMRVAFGGASVYQHPMALVRELVRQGRRDLTVVGHLNGNDVDLLAAAGCLARVETSYVGLEQFGLAPSFRRRVEAGELEVVEYGEVLSWDRFRASQDALPFVTCTYLGGTDLLRNPEIREFPCPRTGRRLWAVPAADPDVVVVHAAAADEHGNVLWPRRHLLPQGLDLLLVRSCDTVIVTVERIVEHELVRRHPELKALPSYRTTCVVHAPFGAHPCSMLGLYDVDEEHVREYLAAAREEEELAAWLERFVTGPADHLDYLERVGLRRLLALSTWTPL